MVISSPYSAFFFQYSTYFWARRPDLWERGSYASGLSLVYFSIHSDAWLPLVNTGVEVGVIYTDYYMYFEADGICREVRHWSYIYTYIDLVHRAAPWHYICRVAGYPSNRRVMSDFPKKSKDILNNKNSFQEID